MKAQNSCKGSRQKAGEKMGEVIVSMKDIVKTFPGVKALDHVNFELRSGEVMALLGERSGEIHIDEDLKRRLYEGQRDDDDLRNGI